MIFKKMQIFVKSESHFHLIFIDTKLVILKEKNTCMYLIINQKLKYFDRSGF